MTNHRNTHGYTIVELILSIAIIAGLSVVIGTFQRDIFSLNSTIQASLNAQLDAQHVTKVMVAELRKVSQSATGFYPLEVASSSAITFYSDVDSNGLQDKVRYFLSGSDLKKGVIVPTGSPLSYNPANEKVTTLISSVISSSTLPLFQYFDGTYTGTSTPLTDPVNTSSVRLIKITVIIDSNPLRSPTALIVTSEVTLRNIKNNL